MQAQLLKDEKGNAAILEKEKPVIKTNELKINTEETNGNESEEPVVKTKTIKTDVEMKEKVVKKKNETASRR